MKPILFVTGTDTGIGKTVFTVMAVKYMRAHGVNAAGLKPVCSGGRGDAKKIHRVMDGALSLDEINPWYYRTAIAPSLAARREGKKVKIGQIAAHVRAMEKKFDVTVVEGAGGLLSPLGTNFNSRDVILDLQAIPIIVAPNRLGVVNHILLTLEALPKNFRAKALVVLMPDWRPDASSKSNAALLAEFFDAKRILAAEGTGFVSRVFQALQ